MGRAAERAAARTAAVAKEAAVMALADLARGAVVGPAVGCSAAEAIPAALKEAAVVAPMEAAAATAAGGVE